MQNKRRSSKRQMIIAALVLIVLLIAGYYFFFSPTVATKKKSETRKGDQSIAVLRFTNMSNEPGQEYFSDGLADGILNSLAHLANLKVSSRTSSFKFHGKN